MSAAAFKAALPARYKQAGRRALLRMASVANAGTGVTCACCDRSFRRFARLEGARVQCPACGSLMRHRALLLYLRDVLRLPETGGDILQVAPGGLQPWLRSLENVRSVSVDIESPLATIQADITTLPFADESFDLILCLHVLEHVPDDRKAMRELLRVLRPGGRAIIQVPLRAIPETFEEPAATTPTARERLFGQYDHVRICGQDYQLRLEEAGFDVESIDYVEFLGAGDRDAYGLYTGEPFYLCERPG